MTSTSQQENDLLNKALDFWKSRKTRFYAARDSTGKPVQYDSPEAMTFCFLGALFRTRLDPPYDKLFFGNKKFYSLQDKITGFFRRNLGKTIMDVNDNQEYDLLETTVKQFISQNQGK